MIDVYIFFYSNDILDQNDNVNGGSDSWKADVGRSIAAPPPDGPSTLASSGNGTSLVGMHGDAVCTSALCIGALVNGSDTQCEFAC